MEKIVELLKEMGVSDELAGQLCEELERFDEEVHQKYEKVYKDRLTKAKQVCSESVENYKLDMARKLSVFLESKVNQIESRVEQQKQLEESQTMGKLRSIREITEDIEVATDVDLKALKDQVRALTEQCNVLKESKKKAEVAANRANKIALDLISERKNVATPEDKKVVEEGEETTVTEQESTEEGTVNTGGRKRKDLKTLKEEFKKIREQAAKPKTTRSTVVESQVDTGRQNGVTSGDDEINNIANQL